MKLEEIKELMKAMEENHLQSLEYRENGVEISLRRGEDERASGASLCAAAAETKAAAQSAAAVQKQTESSCAEAEAPLAKPAAAAAEATAQGASDQMAPEKVVASPLVGTFYASAAPDQDAFVKVGDRVKKGQVLGIIEAMKLMNEIESEYDGVIESILVNNEEVVEYGQPLFRIR